MIRYRTLRRIAALPLIGLAAYAVAGTLGGLIPTNAAWVPPAGGQRIYVEDNGFHTSIVMPARGWEDIVRPAHLGDPRYARHAWRSFGFGDRTFYVETPTYWDARPATMIRALVGSDTTVIHVDAMPEPRVGEGVRSIVLRPDEYVRLVAFIRARFAAGAPVRGYGAYDAFYPAHGHYSAIRTCNAWTGDALRYAGVKVGAWTPFPATLMWWLPR